MGWGESIPRTHRKPEEVSAFNSSPCLTGKWVRPLTSDAKEKPLTGDAKEKSLTGDAKEKSLTGDAKEKSLTSDAKEKPLTSDAKERCLHPALLHLWEGLPSLGKEPSFCVLTGNSVWKSQERRRQAVGSPDRERDAPCPPASSATSAIPALSQLQAIQNSQPGLPALGPS